MGLSKYKVVAAVFLAAIVTASLARADKPGEVKRLRTPNGGIQPQVAVDGKGVLHLIYFRGDPRHGDIFYVRSTDEGATFSHPLRVNSTSGSSIAIGNIRGAHLAVGKNGRVHVAWIGAGKTGLDGMLYARLKDDGTAFEPQRDVIHAAKGLDGGGSVAADDAGNVYVVWHAPQPGEKGEVNRRVWVARSEDEGKTFAAEKAAYEKATGACGCCGLRAFADHKGNVYVLYRSAMERLHRDTYLLTSKDKGENFHGDDVQAWKVQACPMSSFAFAESPSGVLAAWETSGQVYYASIDPATGKRSKPIAAPGAAHERKHPVMAGTRGGKTILVWTEGMGWDRGGAVAWQVYDKNGKATTDKGRAAGVPTWSLVAVFPRKDGGFTIVY
ncbi:MAG TPA: sialidase family protein [Gemmataceae bacterium]|nr:sialidase family protein [Gemmataceae bacterium]